MYFQHKYVRYGYVYTHSSHKFGDLVMGGKVVVTKSTDWIKGQANASTSVLYSQVIGGGEREGGRGGRGRIGVMPVSTKETLYTLYMYS